MNLFTIGINHKTAPIDIREKFYLNATQQRLLLSELKNNPAVIESFVISTCNRTEVYLNVIDFYYPLEEVINLISSIKENKEILSFKNFIYIYREQKSVEHLLRVICGLDSLVLGEKQILGQLKDAFEVARAEGALSKYFNLLTNIALRTGKKAQTETNICYGGSSVSWAAIAMAEKVLDTLENKSVLILGAGKMSELAVKQLAQKKLKKLYLMNRSIDNALNLASKYSGEVVEYCDIKETLTEVDLCICSTNAPHYVLE
ncbi:MAG: glutamyl-tRNA reductase, partial [Candidatus Omnitrophica bacterium]|nr:glutamyl-tRNA reductase [Candidatus Omnitrophota bacterium]